MLTDLPANIIKKLPRYPTVAAVRMGRLAIDEAFKGQGLGGALLADALERTTRSEIAAYALIVDAKNEMETVVVSPLFLKNVTDQPSFQGEVVAYLQNESS